ncbi:copper resistance system multicopper oxidase [Sphingomonas hominis]|uniref:Copper resistance system multicopper oxidase n=1 Tax=Sphingomonas hominis TaxID=2741495 RepID=A0ABX2JJW6_9SPHN|nr:copper resistance system multicopper oxidase [Sphingomonas hominis]NTS66712.1 copper resistance system multicopper oxidase [Sphingomonas hominis]
MSRTIDRRQVLRGAALAGGGLALSAYMPAWAQPVSRGIVKQLPTVSGTDIALTIDGFKLPVDGKSTPAIGVNGTVPAPLIRLKEGQKVRLSVTNNLDEDSSIHWHGLLVPFAMDGVPGISFPGIKARSTFVYEFPVIQSGTYWYHSHSGEQEQGGLYGPIVIDPAGTDPIAFDREHVIVLSDHSQMTGEQIFRKLKQMGGAYFNYQRPTLAGLLAGREMPLKDRVEWGKMRMDPADIADVTGSTYTFLVNGYGPYDNWTGLFIAGERVRLRIINAAAQTNFNVRIPDLPMTVVQADGQNVRPVKVDEFQIGVAETFDVIVTPEDRAYSFVSEAIDRSGMGRATLAPREGMIAPVPPLRPRTLLTMTDMGMDMSSMGGMQGMSGMEGMSGMKDKGPVAKRGLDPTVMQNASRNLWKLTGWNGPTDHGTVAVGAAMAGMSGMDHSQMAAGGAGMAGMDHSQMSGGSMAGMDHGSGGGMSMNMRDPKNAPQVKMGPGVQTISPSPTDRSGEPPQGLEDVDHRVLTYRDLVALQPNPDVRAPSRQFEIHLTGNMERYMWGFDGQKLSDPADPIPFRNGERARITLVNDTMMPHPIHLHGHFFELVTGHGDHAPRKHTVNVPPGGKMTFDLTADAPGDWAFHCHNLYHMTAGMMRVVTVRPLEGAAA